MNDNRRLRVLAGIDMQLMDWNVDILYVIGGDGSMKAAHALWSIASENPDRKQKLRPLSVIGIPKTTDNDILWVWQSFGFLSAVEKARQVVEDLWTEVTSNPRLCIVQLFGSDSGFVVSHSLLASSTGHCNVALIPEIEFSVRGIAKHLKQQMCKHLHRIPYGLVVMAETAIPTDALNYVGRSKGVAPLIGIGLSDNEQDAIRQYDEMRKHNRRIMGQTNDELRTAGLKIVSRGLAKLLVDPKFMQPDHTGVGWKHLRVFTNEPAPSSPLHRSELF
jgi:6-phosphofructokinase 1